jgi:hypothetical protein
VFVLKVAHKFLENLFERVKTPDVALVIPD